MKLLIRVALLAVVLAIVIAGYLVTQREEGPLVLAASSLQESLGAAADAWEAQGHARPVLSFAGTSALARQIQAGAPADLFISADERWMDHVEERDLIQPGTRASFLSNSLVLVAPADSGIELLIEPGFPLAQALGEGRLAMADTDAVPAGRYGKQALTTLGVWDQVSDRIARAENVRAALALVARGEVPLGIVYRTDALAEPGVRVVGRFPESSHEPISYPLAILEASDHEDAEAFRDFLLSGEAKAIFRRYGFGTPQPE